MLNQETIIIFKGKKLTLEKFMEKLGLETLEQAQKSFEILERKGFATLAEEDLTDEQETLKKSIKENVILEVVDELEQEEYNHMQQERQAEIEETESLNMRLPFRNSLEREEFIVWLESLGIDDVETSERKGQISLNIYNVSPREYNKIANRFKADTTVKKAVGTTKKAVTGVAEGINYGATNIVAPTAKIVGEAGMRLGKGLATTVAKTGAGLFTSGSEAVKDTAQALRTDREMLKARAEMREIGDNIKGIFRRRKNRSYRRSGIETF